jgi:uncharacterized protein (TIGR03437 family)
VAVDAFRQVWIAGTTASPEFPNTQGWSGGGDFIAGLDSSGSKLPYAARYPDDAASRSITVDNSGLLHVAGPTGIVSTIAPGSSPVPRIFGVANAANGPVSSRVTAGEVISIYGPHIGPATPLPIVPDASGNFPTAAQGYQVITSLRGSSPLQLLYLSDSQINAVIPFATHVSSPLSVITPNGATPEFPLSVVPAEPEIFRNADNSAIAINQDGTINSKDNPAARGSYVSIWVTGTGLTVDPVANAGQIAVAASNQYCCGVEIDQNTASVVYAGFAPGAVLGVSQVNFQVPAIRTSFNFLPSLRVVGSDGSLSRPVTLYLRN